MAYLIGQLRKNNETIYMIPILKENTTISSPNTFELNNQGQQSNDFTDFALSGNFQSGKVYYLRFRVHKIPQYFYSGRLSSLINDFEAADILSINLILKNIDQDEENYPPENIGNFTVPKAVWNQKSQYVSYSFVFTPSKNYDTLGFRVNRVSYDAIYASSNTARTWLTDDPTDVTMKQRETRDGKKDISTQGPRIEINELCELQNIVTEPNGWNKFGFQSRPGSLIVVNKQPIRVGRSGIYQINNGTKITSFMIASPEGSDSSKIDAFLLDYTYNT